MKRAMVGEVVRVAVGVTPVLAALDLWQAALRHPGLLTPSAALALLGLYAVAGIGVAGLAVLLAPRGRAHALALVLGLGLVAVEGALEALPRHSPWRSVAVAGIVLAAVFALPLAGRALGRRRGPAWLAGVVALVVGFVAAVHHPPPAIAPAPASAPAGPGVVLVVVDTLRADHVGCYGYARPTTPALDRLAAEGTVFTRAFAQASWTKPSTASLLTGTFPGAHGANTQRARLADSALLLPELLARRGYRTALLSGNPWVAPEFGFGQGFAHVYLTHDDRLARFTLLVQGLRRLNGLVDEDERLYNRLKRRLLGTPSTTRRDEMLTDEAARWLAGNGDRPFFLYVHYMSPHLPYDPPPRFAAPFLPERPAGVVGHPYKSYYFKGARRHRPAAPLTEAARAELVARYDGDVLFADGQLERLAATLHALGLAERTLLVVTSDHGDEFFEHGDWGHGQSLYDELLHVPLVLHQPGTVPAGRRIDEPVMSVDVMPTILALVGAPAPGPLAGRSLVPLWERPGGAGGADVFAEALYSYGEARALRRDGLKLIERRTDGRTLHELYDVERDRGERRDLLADAPAGAPVRARAAGHAARLEAAAVRARGHGAAVGTEPLRR